MREREPVYSVADCPASYPEGLSDLVRRKYAAWLRRRRLVDDADGAAEEEEAPRRRCTPPSFPMSPLERLRSAVGTRREFTVVDLLQSYGGITSPNAARTVLNRARKLGWITLVRPGRTGIRGHPAVYAWRRGGK